MNARCLSDAQPVRLARENSSIERNLQMLQAATPPLKAAVDDPSHRAAEKLADRHRRTRHDAENPVVVGQEPGRDLLETRK